MFIYVPFADYYHGTTQTGIVDYLNITKISKGNSRFIFKPNLSSVHVLIKVMHVYTSKNYFFSVQLSQTGYDLFRRL